MPSAGGSFHLWGSCSNSQETFDFGHWPCEPPAAVKRADGVLPHSPNPQSLRAAVHVVRRFFGG